MLTDSRNTGRLIIDLQGTTIDPSEKELLQNSQVAGVILFSRNYVDPSQLRELIAQLRDTRADLLITVDQEGGRVQRLQQGFTRLPALRRIGEVYAREAGRGLTLARAAGWLMAAELLEAGLDLSFAPVLDLYDPHSRVIADRAFAPDAPSVTALALAYIEGMNEAGMAATGKHYPGHGSVIADSHLELPTDERPAEVLLQADFAVFAGCAEQLTAIMPAHVRYPSLDPLCAGYSRFWLQEKLRQELEFTGIIFSDDLSMVAAHVAGGIQSRVAAALEAGCDVLLVCNDRDAAVAACRTLEQLPSANAADLTVLRGQPSPLVRDLRQQPRWQEANDLLASITAPH